MIGGVWAAVIILLVWLLITGFSIVMLLHPLVTWKTKEVLWLSRSPVRQAANRETQPVAYWSLMIARTALFGAMSGYFLLKAPGLLSAVARHLSH